MFAPLPKYILWLQQAEDRHILVQDRREGGRTSDKLSTVVSVSPKSLGVRKPDPAGHPLLASNPTGLYYILSKGHQ